MVDTSAKGRAGGDGGDGGGEGCVVQENGRPGGIRAG